MTAEGIATTAKNIPRCHLKKKLNAEQKRLVDGMKNNNLTEDQKTTIKWTYQNAKGLIDPNGDWSNDSSAVVETGSMIAWQLEQAFPFLEEGV